MQSLIAETVLREKGVVISGYCDNSNRAIGKYLRDKLILDPEDVFRDKEQYYIIIAVRACNEIRMQLMRHDINDYSTFLL